MHKLTKYRKASDLTMLQVANALGVTESAVSLWESGRRIPRLAQILAIEKYTDGEVTAYDWQPQHEGAL